jgi:hypothetical protein
MQTCECCLRAKPELECVQVNWWLRTVNRLPAPLGVTPVCSECVVGVRRVGLFALVGFVAVGIFAFVMLGFSDDLLSIIDHVSTE